MPQKLNHKLPGTSPTTRTLDTCLPWRALLPEAAEDLLDPYSLQSLEQHLAGCSACRDEMAEAQRGLAWLTVLKDGTPAPPETMLASVLAATTGAEEAGVFLPEQVSLATDETEWAGDSWQIARRWVRGEQGTWSSLLQPHIAMTGAMAFLSLCLTVNLLSDSIALHNPGRGGLERTVATTEASVMRSIHGLRVVYEVGSRVNELRSDSASSTPLNR